MDHFDPGCVSTPFRLPLSFSLAPYGWQPHQVSLPSPAGESKAASPLNTTQAAPEPRVWSVDRNQTMDAATKAGARTLPVLARRPPKNDNPSTSPPRSKRLDIVLMHYHPDTVPRTLEYWLDFLKSNKVRSHWQTAREG